MQSYFDGMKMYFHIMNFHFCNISATIVVKGLYIKIEARNI